MADIDRQKEWIGVLKTSFFFLLATLFVLIAYLFENFDKLATVRLVFINITITIITISTLLSAKKLKQELEKLKDMEMNTIALTIGLFGSLYILFKETNLEKH
ncbi:MAG: hypothetical protein GXO62_07890 [Epsilonproteobacteria bacterium]|nr:hypothetical protein [Campylobacterota bacterium]